MCADNSIEDKIKTCSAHGCRVCKHFIRVNYDGIENVSHRQGFCILGGLEGDYSLYISKTAKDCCGYIFSESHEKITIAETDLSKQMSEFEHRCEDKRTSDYKQIEPMLDETRKYIQSMGHKGFAANAARRGTLTIQMPGNIRSGYMLSTRMAAGEKTGRARITRKPRDAGTKRRGESMSDIVLVGIGLGVLIFVLWCLS